MISRETLNIAAAGVQVDRDRNTAKSPIRSKRASQDDCWTLVCSTDSETKALEMADLSHGVFTYALMQGLSGAADPQRDGEVELFALQSYVSREVRNLTNRRQSPAIHLSGVTDFVIARK
jgi:uncharacterized caspase-like protein